MIAAVENDLRVREATSADQAAWSAFVGRQAAGEFAHSWEFSDALFTVFGLRPIRLVVERGPSLAGVLPLVHQRSPIGSFLTSMPYVGYAGVLADDQPSRHALADEAKALAERLAVDRLELRGREAMELPLPTWDGKRGFELELPGESEALWSGLGSKIRSQVNRPRREGYSVRIVGAGGHREFCPLLERRWHELGSPVLPRTLFRQLEQFAGDDFEYLLVTRDRQVVAAGATIATGDRVEIPWAASAREHNRFGVNMLLYWSALERAIERGARRFDFGRSNPGSGHARFKLQWGATERRLEWHVHIRSARGRSAEPGGSRRGLAATCWQHLPAFVARRIGPVLAARIPL